MNDLGEGNVYRTNPDSHRKVLINLNRVEVVMPRKENEENTILLLSDGDFVRVEEDYETIKQRIKNLERQK